MTLNRKMACLITTLLKRRKEKSVFRRQWKFMYICMQGVNYFLLHFFFFILPPPPPPPPLPTKKKLGCNKCHCLNPLNFLCYNSDSDRVSVAAPLVGLIRFTPDSLVIHLLPWHAISFCHKFYHRP